MANTGKVRKGDRYRYVGTWTNTVDAPWRANQIYEVEEVDARGLVTLGGEMSRELTAYNQGRKDIKECESWKYIKEKPVDLKIKTRTPKWDV